MQSNVPLYLKFAVGVLCAGIWAGFAYTGKADATGLMEFAKMTLVGLAAHLLSTNQPVSFPSTEK